jgi:hypothetical protein
MGVVSLSLDSGARERDSRGVQIVFTGPIRSHWLEWRWIDGVVGTWENIHFLHGGMDCIGVYVKYYLN